MGEGPGGRAMPDGWPGRGPTGTRGAAPARRAPRLAPDERIAALLTRSGRFARIDPLVAKPLPTIPRVLGVVGWAVLTVEALRRARRAVAGGGPAG